MKKKHESKERSIKVYFFGTHFIYFKRGKKPEFKNNKLGLSCSEGRESRSRLGLETKGTETLGLVSVSY